jgi:hypothetical protein
MSSIHDEVICDSCILCELSGGALPAAYPHNESYALIVHSLHSKPGNKEAKLRSIVFTASTSKCSPSNTPLPRLE